MSDNRNINSTQQGYGYIRDDDRRGKAPRPMIPRSQFHLNVSSIFRFLCAAWVPSVKDITNERQIYQ